MNAQYLTSAELLIRQTEPRNGPPTVDDVSKLPRWAVVAFAARCARRKFPQLAPGWEESLPKEADRNLLQAIEYAIHSAEEAGAGSHIDSAATNIAGQTALSHMSGSAAAASCAAFAAVAAVAADRNAAAQEAANAALNAVPGHDGDAFIDAMWTDFELVKMASEAWTDAHVFPPEYFGPLWREGPPRGRLDEQGQGQAMAIKVQIAVPSGQTEAETIDFENRVARFFAALSGVDVSMGGTGLRFMDDCSSESVESELEAPSDSDLQPAGAGT